MLLAFWDVSFQLSQVDDAAAESMELQRVRTGKMAKDGLVMWLQ